MIDFGKSLKNVDGVDIKVDDKSDAVATLGWASVNALLAQYRDEADLSGDEKVKRFALAMKIQDSKKVDLPVEDIALIKKLVAKMYSPLIVGRCWQLLDPKKG